MFQLNRNHIRNFNENFYVTVESRCSQKVSIGFYDYTGIDYSFEEPDFFEEEEIIFVFDSETNEELYKLSIDESDWPYKSSIDIIQMIISNWVQTGSIRIDD